MSDGHKTTTIPRPELRVDRARPDSTRITSALTKSIPADKRLVKGRGKRIVFALAGLVIAAALVASLFVLPVKSWLQQRRDLAHKQEQLAVLNDANGQLAADINRLQTADGVKEAARQEVGYVGLGEERISVLSMADAPLTLPTGWPYDTISQIIAVRAAPPPVQPATP